MCRFEIPFVFGNQKIFVIDQRCSVNICRNEWNVYLSELVTGHFSVRLIVSACPKMAFVC